MPVKTLLIIESIGSVVTLLDAQTRHKSVGCIDHSLGEIDSRLILSEAESKPQAAYMAQLDKLAKQLNNEKVSLADFNDAFQIQKLVEEGLRRSIQI